MLNLLWFFAFLESCLERKLLSHNKRSVWPSISVVVSTYNRENVKDEALNSIIAQDYPHLEIIVVDDGSVDQTIEKVRAFGDRVRLVQQANQRPGPARVAWGEYFAFLDGDDVWLPGKLRAQVQYVKDNSDIQLLYGRWQRRHPASDGCYKSAHHTHILRSIKTAMFSYVWRE